MKLRNMSANVDFVDSITLKLEDGDNIHLENAYVLTSYASRVAVYCKMRVYLLPAMNTALRRGNTFTLS